MMQHETTPHFPPHRKKNENDTNNAGTGITNFEDTKRLHQTSKNMPPFANCQELLGDSYRSILSQPSQKENAGRRPAKNVAFSHFDEIIEIPHLNGMSVEEISKAWFSRREMADMQQRSRNILSILDQDGRQDGRMLEGLCLRGLMQHHPFSIRKSKEMLYRLYDIVCECQTFEDTYGVPVPDELCAQHLSAVSRVSEKEARQRALLDQKDAIL
jgi:hypothetical protein